MIKNCATCGYNGDLSVCKNCLFFSKWISKMDYAAAVSKTCEETSKGDETINRLVKDMLNSRYGVRGTAEVKYVPYAEMMRRCAPHSNKPRSKTLVPSIKRVIFSEPCTIVLWSDNTKTIVRAQDDDIYDPEKGMAMAIAKKALGNKGDYYDVFNKWLPKEEEVDVESLYPKLTVENFKNAADSVKEFLDGIINRKKEEAEKPMTCREKLAMECPVFVDYIYRGGCKGCPHNYDYAKRPEYCGDTDISPDILCGRCWDRPVEIKEDKHEV